MIELGAHCTVATSCYTPQQDLACPENLQARQGRVMLEFRASASVLVLVTVQGLCRGRRGAGVEVRFGSWGAAGQFLWECGNTEDNTPDALPNHQHPTMALRRLVAILLRPN